MADEENELLDYDEEQQDEPTPAGQEEKKKDVKVCPINWFNNDKSNFLIYFCNNYHQGSYVSIHSSGFRDFLLKPELLRAIVDCGFEHPSQVQNECIPQAVLGMDVLCQAKSGTKRSYILYYFLIYDPNFSVGWITR